MQCHVYKTISQAQGVAGKVPTVCLVVWYPCLVLRVSVALFHICFLGGFPPWSKGHFLLGSCCQDCRKPLFHRLHCGRRALWGWDISMELSTEFVFCIFFPCCLFYSMPSRHHDCPPFDRNNENPRASRLTLQPGTELGHLQADVRAERCGALGGPTPCTLFIPPCTTFPILFNNLIYIFLSSFLAAGYAACKMDWECHRWAD